MKLKIVLALAALALTVPSFAAKETYSIDTAHSSVTFSIRHLVSKVKGSFKDFSGTIETDPAKPTDATISATIKSTSIDTGNTKRDDHLRNEDFFDVKKFPEITFKSTKVTGKGKKFKMEGKLTMHGVEKPVVMDVEFMGVQKDPWGNEKAGFNAKTKIKRADYKIVYNKALETGGVLLGEDVEIEMDIQAQKEVPKEAKK